MVLTCFFCQNLFSDFEEGILPKGRHEEIANHVESCSECSRLMAEFRQTVGLLKGIPHRPLSHEMALRITEASQAGTRRLFNREVWSRTALVFLALVLVGATALAVFPSYFPWISKFTQSSDSQQFSRYYPLLQGGGEIIDEQANWIHAREPFSRSVWEEGGLSPDEFEKAFQVNSPKGEEN